MPWCHVCRVEYREEIATCVDCGGAVVPDLPPPKAVASPTLLLKTPSLEEAHAVRALLEGHGIDCFLENEFGPSFAIGLPTMTVPYGLYVPSDEFDEARALVGEAKAEAAKEAPVERPPRRWWPWILGAAAVLLVIADAAPDGGQGFGFGPWCAWTVILAGVLHLLRTRSPEPRMAWSRLLMLAGSGACLGIIIALLPTVGRSELLGPIEVYAVFVGPVLEELGKIVGVTFVFLLNPAWRKPRSSWLLAGAAAGAGFGLTENLLYYGGGVGMLPLATAFLMRSGALFHLIDTMCFGYFAARGNPVAGFFLAVALHAGWNALVFLELAYLLPVYGGVILWVLWRRLPSMLRALEPQEMKVGPPEEGPPAAVSS